MDAPDGLVSPFQQLGSDAARIRALVEHFYDVMERDEPALAQLHARDANGRVAQGSRDRFAMFFVGWLGGPQDYIEKHGHPRLRMRHGRVPINTAMRDAWLRTMRTAMDDHQVTGDVRRFLDAKLADLADFLRNVPG